jgi:hypothetical protein
MTFCSQSVTVMQVRAQLAEADISTVLNCMGKC